MGCALAEMARERVGETKVVDDRLVGLKQKLDDTAESKEERVDEQKDPKEVAEDQAAELDLGRLGALLAHAVDVGKGVTVTSEVSGEDRAGTSNIEI